MNTRSWATILVKGAAIYLLIHSLLSTGYALISWMRQANQAGVLGGGAMPYSPVEYFGWPALNLLAAITLLALSDSIIRWLSRVPAVRKTECDACGYELAGLNVLKCPECGSPNRLYAQSPPPGNDPSA